MTSKAISKLEKLGFIIPDNLKELENNSLRGCAFRDIENLKSPMLWNAFINMNGRINIEYSDDNDENNESRNATYDSNSRRRFSKLIFDQKISYYKPLIGVNLFAHELGHFIDNKSPFVVRATDTLIKSNMGRHSSNPLWLLIYDLEKINRDPHLRKIEEGVEGAGIYSDKVFNSEYFTFIAENYFDKKSVTPLAALTKKYFSTIVEFDVALCNQNKEIDAIIEDRKSFFTLIRDHVNDAFKKEMLRLANGNMPSTVENKLSGKMDQIIKAAKEKFQIPFIIHEGKS